MPSTTTPMLVSFSGIDGAGKSTQIERLSARLSAAGLSVLHLAFWDHVVFLPALRASVSHRVLRGELGVGAPGKAVKRNDKNVRKWYLTLARSPLYLLDVLSLRRIVKSARRVQPDVIIFDRYIYDQLVNLAPQGLGRSYAKMLLQMAPRPDVAFLLDAIPEAALQRKPEYPLDFLYKYRRAYFGLSEICPEMVVVSPADVDIVTQFIEREVEKRSNRLQSLATNRVAAPQRISA